MAKGDKYFDDPDKTFEWMVKLWCTLVRGIVTMKWQLLNSLFEQRFEAIHIYKNSWMPTIGKEFICCQDMRMYKTGCSCVCRWRQRTWASLSLGDRGLDQLGLGVLGASSVLFTLDGLDEDG